MIELLRADYRFVLKHARQEQALLAEVLLGSILPMIMLFFEKIRASRFWMFISSMFAIHGFMANRINVTNTGMRVEGVSGPAYIMHILEIIISLFLFVCRFVLFTLAVKYLSVYSDDKTSLEKI
jgi:Ni/Fe-hydrogenase subunit HybB-like protein